MGNKHSNVNPTGGSVNLQTDLENQLATEHQVAVLAQVKERRRHELLAFEEQLTAQIEKETQLTLSSKQQQTKLLNDVADTQKELDKQLFDIHQKQELNRQRLAEEINQLEVKLHSDIEKFLRKANEESGKIQTLLQQGEEELQKLLSVKVDEYSKLEKAAILAAMEDELAKCLENVQHKKINIINTLDEPANDSIGEVLRNRQKDQAELISKLASEESLQQQAFASLLAKRDQLSQQLRCDIDNVINKLNQLTNLELKRQHEKSETSTVALSEMRIQLAELLSQLLKQQQRRKEDLQNLLQQMEKQRLREIEDYWLVQYQRVVDSMPAWIDQPFAQPSAPTPPRWAEPGLPHAPDEASAPPLDQVYVETCCVVCMDAKCQVIFLPCGHLCCCFKCNSSVVVCPLCRVAVAQKLQIFT